MATYSLGHIEPFHFEDDWHSYTERVQQFFCGKHNCRGETNGGYFPYHHIRAKCYNLLRTSIVPAKPSDKKFIELVEILCEHLKPQPVVIAERFKFYKRIQRGDESAADFMLISSKLSEHCQFGDFLVLALRGHAGLWTEKYSCTEETLDRNQVGIEQSSGNSPFDGNDGKQALTMKTDVQNMDSEVKLLKSRSWSHWSAACRPNNW